MRPTADILTWSRVILAIPSAWALSGFLEGNLSPLPFISLYALACLTDILDGKIARAQGTCSEHGARLDVVADLLISGAATGVLTAYGELSAWYLTVMLLQFAVFFSLSGIRLRYDVCGRAAGWLFCAVPLMAVLLHGNVWDASSMWVQVAICTMAVMSMFGRIRASMSEKNPSEFGD